VLLRWDGVAWTQAAYPVGGGLFRVAMISVDSGWASGAGGAILYWNGSGWNATTPYVDRTYTLEDIAMASPGNGWAVGQQSNAPLLMRWDGAAWSPVDSPASQRLRAIDLISADDGWAVGDYGTILHWDGQAWSQVASPTGASMHGIDMLSATDGWIVSGYPGIFLHWDGSAWSQVGDQTYHHLYDIDMLSAVDGWAVGEGDIWHWDGLAWQPMQGTDVLYDIDMLTPTDGWVGGGYYWGEEGWETVLGRWNGASWSLDQDWGWPIRSIAMLSPTDGWAVGGGTHRDHWGCSSAGWEFKRWDGAAWVDVGNPSGRRLNAVTMLSATEGWAVGEGTILHYSSTQPPRDVYLPVVLRQ
jgi:hypothetical protein